MYVLLVGVLPHWHKSSRVVDVLAWAELQGGHGHDCTNCEQGGPELQLAMRRQVNVLG